MNIKSLLIIVAAAFMVISCGGNRSKNANVEAVATLEVDALLSSAAEFTDKVVEVEGICTHICQHGGRKMFLMGSNDTNTIRIEAGELGAFPHHFVNSFVKVKGTLCEERIDETYLQNWEAAVAAKTAEEHGDGESGCDTEKKARGETANTTAERIADFRAKIAARKAAEGKDYLSFYYILALSHEVLK